jgi:hypothetical protein
MDKKPEVKQPDVKPAVDRESLKALQEVKEAAVKTNQIVKK